MAGDLHLRNSSLKYFHLNDQVDSSRWHDKYRKVNDHNYEAISMLSCANCDNVITASIDLRGFFVCRCLSDELFVKNEMMEITSILLRVTISCPIYTVRVLYYSVLYYSYSIKSDLKSTLDIK